ncbi:MAG: aminopeptidase P family protein, partial [candidate division KSB1 bacterium]|nr:aminopeptidase P family protein [candidate division KSB1 bacterium]
MKKPVVSIVVLISLLCVSSLIHSQTKSTFIARRQAAINRLSPNGVAILQTSQRGHRWGFNFQQESNLFYLTGINDPGVVLILSKAGINFQNQVVHAILITNLPPDKVSNSETFYRALQDSLGFDLVGGAKEQRKIIDEISNIDKLFTNTIIKNQKEGKSLLEKRLIKLTDDWPNLEIANPNELTAEQRRIKSAEEIRLMQRAIDITTLAHKEAMKSMTPGLFEYQIEAVVEYIFKFHGSQQLAFPTIVGSGPNSLDLHYELGVRQIESGDMVVVDIGCEYNHYCADITRTIPASGKFTPQQKEIYNIVLEANQAVIDMLKPGVTMAQMDSLVKAIFQKYGYEKYWRHGCTHHLGLDVHDVGDTSLPLAPGCIVTVEPGLYIPPNSDLPKEYWNIGVRIEDDVLITEDGHRVLTAAC